MEIKNQFAGHGIFWMLTLPLLAIVILPALLPSSDFKLTAAEVSFFRDVLGRSVNSVTKDADMVFNSLFVKTHIASFIGGFFRHSGELHGNALIRDTAVFSADYNNGLWLMVYRGLWRMCGLWPAMLAIAASLAAPCLIDGLMVRARKSYTFRFHNPVFFWTASHSVIIIIGLGVFLPFLPIGLTAISIVGFAVLLCAGVWVTAANFQTGN